MVYWWQTHNITLEMKLLNEIAHSKWEYAAALGLWTAELRFICSIKCPLPTGTVPICSQKSLKKTAFFWNNVLAAYQVFLHPMCVKSCVSNIHLSNTEFSTANGAGCSLPSSGCPAVATCTTGLLAVSNLLGFRNPSCQNKCLTPA